MWSNLSGFRSLFLCALGYLLSATVVLAAEPAFQCEAHVAGESKQLAVSARSDPYQFDSLDLPSNFRLTAQYLPRAGTFKTWVYHDSKKRYVLIHTSDYALGAEACASGQRDFGVHKVYSASLEKELRYQCRLLCPSERAQ